MLGTALYYPHIDIRDAEWLKTAVLFWDEIQTIVPSSIENPYNGDDTRICAQEGYLRPLRCDLHPEVLDALGARVLKLMEATEWSGVISHGPLGGPSERALIHADKLGNEMRWRLEEMVGIHPEEMPPELRALAIQLGGLELLSAGKLPPRLRHMMDGLQFYRMHPEKLSRELRHLRRQGHHHESGDWIIVDGRFAAIYMSALAALLAREIDISPLTNEEPSAGVNLRCLIDDVTTNGPTAARGALVSVVMESLRVDPETPIGRLLAFRRARRDQLAELSGEFDTLKTTIENSANERDLEINARRIFENRIRPSLARLQNELRQQTIASAWEGFQTAATLSAAPTVALWATGLPSPVALGIGAFITATGIGVKSYLSRAKLRSASPYTYLLDIQGQFSVPQ